MENDNLVTLDEPLAFIDFCEDESATTRFSTTSVSLLPLEAIDDLLNDAMQEEKAQSPQLPSLVSSELPLKKKKRFRNASSSSTALQRRRKAETQTLREKGQELEGYLAQLKRARDQSLKRSNNEVRTADEFAQRRQADQFTSEWRRRALTEYQVRLQSEQTNTRLKEILHHQLKVNNKHQGTLKRPNAISGRDFIQNVEVPVLQDAFFTMNHTNTFLSQLRENVESLYQNFGHVFLPQQPPMICSTVEPKYNERSKARTVEFATTTPLECSGQAVSDVLWSFLDKNSIPGQEQNSLERETEFSLHHRGSAMQFNKLHYLRKFEEKDRIVIIWSDCMLLSSRRLQYHTLGYAVITPSFADPINRCVVHTTLKLDVECGAYQPSGVLKEAQDIALGALSRMMRSFWNTEQNRLLSEAARVEPEPRVIIV